MKRILFAMMTVAGTIAFAAPALAQMEPAPAREPKPPRIVYPANQVITFEPTEIRGGANQPAGAFIAVRQSDKFPVLIDERAHFKAALVKSTYDLR